VTFYHCETYYATIQLLLLLLLLLLPPPPTPPRYLQPVFARCC
jgi:hypothetical protein